MSYQPNEISFSLLIMKPTDILVEDHEIIKIGLKALDKVSEKIHDKRGVEIQDIEYILDFIKTFADDVHHKKEEELLFPAMQKAGIQREGGPIQAMLMEHDMGRFSTKGMVWGLEEIKSGSEKARTTFTHHAINYLAILGQHIDKENHCLFPMANMAIPQNIQIELVQQMRDVEAKRIGIEKRHTYRTELEKLYSKYY